MKNCIKHLLRTTALIISTVVSLHTVSANNFSPFSPPSIPSNGVWSPLGNGLGINGFVIVYDMAWDSQGNLYAVGSFNIVNQAYQDGFAKWDGTSWQYIALDSLFGSVLTIAIDANDQVYLGGKMQLASGIPVNNFVKWDGNSFIELPGTDGWIYDLEFDNFGSLYAVGSFSNAGGIRANNIATFDGCRWHALEEGLNDEGYSLDFDSSNNLYVGGRFKGAGGVDAEGVAKWDGQTWYSAGNVGISGTLVKEVAYVEQSNTLYIGGSFTSVDGITASNIAAFNGQTWSNLGNGLDSPVSTLIVDPQGNLYVGGNFQSSGSLPLSRVAKWDGIAWQAMDTGIDDAVRICALSPGGELHIGGQFTAASGNTVNGIAKWGPSTQASALNFDGTDDFISIADHNDLEFDTDEDFSIEVNVRIPTTPQNNLQSAGNVIIEKWNGNAIGYPYAIRYLNQTNQYPGKIRAGRGDGTNYPSITSTTSVNDGQWHHIAFVKDSSQLLLYIDGVLEATGTDNTTNTTVNGLNVNIGRRNNNTVHFTGDIDELRIWKRALCSVEINAAMDCEIDPLQVDSLNAYFRFNDEQISGIGTTTLQNEINSSLNGTLDSFDFTGLISNWIDDGSIIDGTTCSIGNDPCGSQGSSRVDNSNGFSTPSNQGIKAATLDAEGLVIFPNPSSDNFLIQWEEDIQASSIQVINNNGQEVWNKKVYQGQNSIQILKSEARLLPGLHYIKIQTVSESLIHKIMIK